MEILNIIVLSLTFIAIVWYTYETKKLRVITGKSFHQNNFSSLLNSYQMIINSIEYEDTLLIPKITLKGDKLFNKIVLLLNKKFKELYEENKESNIKDICKEIYSIVFTQNISKMSNIIMFLNICDSILINLNMIKKTDYSEYEQFNSHFKSLISMNAAILLYYYSISEYCYYQNLYNESGIFTDNIFSNNELMHNKVFELIYNTVGKKN